MSLSEDLLKRSPINRLAPGLLGFLGLKSAGAGPGRLGFEVQPTFNLQEFWQLERYAYDSKGGFAVAGAAVTSANAQIPAVVAGENWLILGCGVRFRGLAATVTALHGGLFVNAGGGANQTGVPVHGWNILGLGLVNAVVATKVPAPFWLLSGESVGIDVTCIGAGGGFLELNYRYVRFPL